MEPLIELLVVVPATWRRTSEELNNQKKSATNDATTTLAVNQGSWAIDGIITDKLHNQKKQPLLMLPLLYPQAKCHHDW